MSERKADELSERFMGFAVRLIRLCKSLPSDYAANHIGKQILRSGTAIGANYEEARGAESRADFLHKLRICLKEARETVYWLKILKRAEFFEQNKLDDIIKESEEIANILGQSVLTVKSKG